MPFQENSVVGSTETLITGGSEMAVRTREFPWEGTALGSIERWSASLVSAVNFVLASPVSTILMVGAELTVLYNDAYILTLAERHPHALGMRGDVLWADAWGAVGHQIEAVLATGESFKFDNVLIPVDRAGVLTDTYFTYSFSPIFEVGASGVAGVMCMAQDVTVSHRAVLEKQEAEQKLTEMVIEHRRVLDATTDAIVSVDRDFNFTFLNPAAVQAYSFGRDLIGCNLWETFPDAARPDSPFFQHYHLAMDDNRASTFEAYYPKPLDRWIRLSVYPTPEGIVTFSRDITEEKRSAELLLRTEKLAAVGRLASTIAHEINNPLEAVTNLLFISKLATQDEALLGYLTTAEVEIRRVSVIANQTLQFHKQHSRPSEITCLDLFTNALLIFQGRIDNAGIRVEKRKRAERPVACLEGEIRQVMNNLIGNAIDAMKSGGRLLVRSAESTDWRTGRKGLRLIVADTGTGMSKETLSRLFEPFYSTKGINGTGLGLWVSQEIVQRHHGRLQVRSSAEPGRSGSVFSLFLPFSDANSGEQGLVP